MKKIASVVAAALIFCLTAVTSAFAEVEQVDVPKHDPVIVKFAALDPAKAPISDAQLLETFAHNLIGSSAFPYKYENQGNFAGPNGRRMHTVEKHGLTVKVDLANSKIMVSYIHLETHEQPNEMGLGQTLTLPIAYTIEHANDTATIKLTPPEKSELSTRSWLLTRPKLEPTNLLLNDFMGLLDRAGAIKLNLQVQVRGEVTSNYKPDSLLSNFERMLGIYQSGYAEGHMLDPKRENFYAYRVGQDRVPLKISTFPYHDGSKIVYETKLPYVIGADGSTSGYEAVDTLKNAVEKIVND